MGCTVCGCECENPVTEAPARAWSPEYQVPIFAWFAKVQGNMVVTARAGTGKTTTIVEALRHIPRRTKALTCAFNKRIQLELEARLGLDNVEAKTLHGLGFSYIRKQWRNVKVDAAVDWDRARAATNGTAPDDVVTCVKKLAEKLKGIAPFTADLDEVSRIAEQFDCIPADEWQGEGWDLAATCRAGIKARDAAKVQDPAGRISFDDMVYIPIACGFARAWFDLVVVDEAQDMNYAQLVLAQKACKKGGRLVAVGDDCQAIYGFRGADSDSLARLTREWSATELGLKVTYRCGKSIVALAQTLVPDFQAGPGNPDGVVDECDRDGLYASARPGDFVLSRKNAPLLPLCLGLLKRGVRARIEGRDIGKALRDIVSSLKAKSVPHYLERVQAWGEKASKRAGKIKHEDVRKRKLDEISDQVEVLQAIAEGCANVAEIVTRCDTLFGDDPADGRPRGHVVLSSVHKAKGLDAERVYVLASTLSTRNQEEKNIAYVAYTRAKAQLTLVREALDTLPTVV